METIQQWVEMAGQSMGTQPWWILLPAGLIALFLSLTVWRILKMGLGILIFLVILIGILLLLQGGVHFR